MVVAVVSELVERIFVATCTGCIGTNCCQSTDSTNVLIAGRSSLALALEMLSVRDVERSIACKILAHVQGGWKNLVLLT